MPSFFGAMIDQVLQILVIGGGAAGFFGAIACAQTYPHVRVILLEANRQPLAKVRISGGGRCNVTHACFDVTMLVQNYPRGGRALRGALTRFQPRQTIDWFARYGVELKTEADGRMFPTTDDSATIVECLMRTAKAAGVTIRTGIPAIALHKPADGSFEIELKSGEILVADRLLIATGSHPQGYQWARELGHTIESPVPSLFTFNIVDRSLRELAGVSVNPVCLRLPDPKLTQTGPLLLTHWGFSGPAILKLSAWGARFLAECQYQTRLLVNWLPDENPEILRQQLQEHRAQSSKKSIGSYCPFPLAKRLWHYLLDRVEIDPQTQWAQVSNQTLNKLLLVLTQSQYQITGKGIFKEEFVTCGGVNLKEVNFKTMESRCCPHLYFAGEILDIDGVTGGFNFQSAWTTGWIAGNAMGQGTSDR
jgi:predicted Rossmann fold flavoprotein